MAKILIILAIFIGLFGCANNVWVKSGAGVNDFNVDSGQCNAQSYSVPFANVYQQAAVQNQCMQGKGWTLRDKNAHEASVASVDSSWQSVKAKHDAETNALCKDPAYKLIYLKTSCLSSDITLEQMTDGSKITAQQKVPFIELRKILSSKATAFFESAKNIHGSSGEKLQSLYLTTLLPETDKNNIDLYAGKITWGEWNQRRKEIGLKFQQASKNIK
jgi:hypothetical protein